MDELEEKLNQLLSDPAELARLSRLASELFGAPEPAAEAKPEPSPGALPGGGKSDISRLIRALSPFLRPERLGRLQRAQRLAGAARLALLGMETLGGTGDV